MSGLPKRSLAEVITRYQLEPTLKDIYVEGIFDKELLTYCFKKNDCNDRIVYEIDTVEISHEILISYGLSTGNKQRTIALAKEINKLTNDPQVIFLIDKDLDEWLDSMEEVHRLVRTKYSSLELYFFDDILLQDILLEIAKTKIQDWEEYKSTLILFLQSFFAIRLTNEELALGMELIPIGKYLSLQGSKINFEIDRYNENLLNKNSKAAYKDIFEECRSGWMRKLTGDPRHYMHGHDFTQMLAWTVLKFNGIKEFSSQVAIERMFLMQSPKAEEILETFKV